MKSLSIIIPIFNECKNLRKLAKLLKFNLKIKNYEVIFVDDDSFDGSLDVLKDIKKKNRNFIFLF